MSNSSSHLMPYRRGGSTLRLVWRIGSDLGRYQTGRYAAGMSPDDDGAINGKQLISMNRG